MWLSLILIGLLIGISFRQSAQGFFNALVMAAFSVCCAVAAFGSYEWVAVTWVLPLLGQQSAFAGYALPVSLAVLYGVPCALLYLGFRFVNKRPIKLPSLADRLGATACGLLTGLVTVGTLAVCLQMVPFERGSILGYSRIALPDVTDPNAPPITHGDESELFLRLDRFVVSLTSVLSHGVFSGSNRFYDHNPDLVQAIGWNGAAPSMVSRYAPPNSIRVERSEAVQFVYKMTPADTRRELPAVFEPEPASGGNEFRMIRVQLRNEARNQWKGHTFMLRQFRLVGKRAGEDIFEQFHAMAIQQPVADAAGAKRHVRSAKLTPAGQFHPLTDWPLVPPDGDRAEIVFELPIGFEPSFLEYKRGARAAVSFTSPPATPERTTEAPAQPQPQRTAAATPATPQVAAQPAPGQRPGRNTRADSGTPERTRRGRGARSRAVAANEGQSRFSDEFPLTLRTYQQVNADVTNGRLVTGHLIAETAGQEQGTNPEVARFFVPEGKRLLQLSSERLQARSGLGRAISFATSTVQAYFVEDQNSNPYQLVGKYAKATVNGKEVFEVQYFSSPVGSIGGISQFNRINEKELKPEDEFVLLFLIDPGVRITSFSTGGSASRRDDLTADNLVAPE